MRIKTRNTKIQKAILQSVGAIGLLSVVLLAPNALQMLKIFDKKKYRNSKQSINNSRRRMIERGLLEYKDKFLRLTPKGEARLKELERRYYKLPRPKKLDKKWRVLIFDIPEKRKSLREKIRLTLRALGFLRLQDSVWVFPYDCEDLITLLKADFHIGRDLLYLIVDTIEYDLPLRKQFGLNIK